MCCCEKPNINGTPGFAWNEANDGTHKYPVARPALGPDDHLIHDEPGRCMKGLDAHSHHYCVVLTRGRMFLLVRHGGGDERISLHYTSATLAALVDMDTTERYSMLHTLYYAYRDGRTKGSNDENEYWKRAAAEKRIKVRKIRGTDLVKVVVTPIIVP